MNKKKWLSLCALLLAIGMLFCTALVYIIDPYFHYHAPLPGFFYRVDSPRSQNFGIAEHFEFDGLITGSSMTQNFKASEAENLFGGKCIKIPLVGAYFSETDAHIEAALGTHPELSYVIRGLDLNFFNIDPDARRTDLGVYPDYLYDDNIINDVKYVFNKDTLFRSLVGLAKRLVGYSDNEVDFDSYSTWSCESGYGPEALLTRGESFEAPADTAYLSAEEEALIRANVRQNITALPEKYPDTEFFYFITPYSAVYWAYTWQDGNLDKMLSVEETAIDEIIKADVPNLRLFAYDNLSELTGNLSVYKDTTHYISSINTWLLEAMSEGKGLITKENSSDYCRSLREYYEGFDFNSLYNQLP